MRQNNPYSDWFVVVVNLDKQKENLPQNNSSPSWFSILIKIFERFGGPDEMAWQAEFGVHTPVHYIYYCVANHFLCSCVYDRVRMNHESEINYYYYLSWYVQGCQIDFFDAKFLKFSFFQRQLTSKNYLAFSFQYLAFFWRLLAPEMITIRFAG